jgi:copper chaperone CopZ
MVHQYQIKGMTCGNCVANVKSALLMVPYVTEVEVSKELSSATISMEKHISLNAFQSALDPKYQISALSHSEMTEQAKTWFETYKPVLLIFAYISISTVLINLDLAGFDWMQWMQDFMAAFFLVFSFFKLLNLKGFAESYQMYDIVAKQFKVWAYIYPFIELALGLAFLLNFNFVVTNSITFLVMGISIIGVLQSVLNKKKIQCACLGAVFNLPMSTITIIEDTLMIGMSAWMLFYHFNN